MIEVFHFSVNSDLVFHLHFLLYLYNLLYGKYKDQETNLQFVLLNYKYYAETQICTT